MKEIIRKLLTVFIGKNEDTNFTIKLTFSSILFLIFVSLFGIVINLSIKLDLRTVIIAIVSFIIYSSIYISGRFYNKYFLAKSILTIYTFLICNVFWFFNYGSRGPVIYIYLPYLAIMIFIWNQIELIIICIGVFFNLLFFIILEFNFPNLSNSYPSERARIVDSYTGLLMFIGFMLILVIYAKNNYIKQYERAKQSDNLKSKFLANMSHEIRTPLNAILGFSKLIANRELTEDKKELYTNIINDNSNYLMKLISDILDISMIESEQLKIRVSDIDINNLLKQIYNSQKNSLKVLGKTNVNFILKIPDETILINSDELRIEQVLVNLVSNAIKFTFMGKIELGYYLENNNIVFYVEDSGIGINPQFQNEVFDRFIKTESPDSDVFFRGAGLGLALSKELVNLLKGNIWFTSEYQKGSKFFFSLPIC
jgi:signal transduction histidine kinase